jgi:radical SAM protein with 4Fe4S-binding SPASM domain
MVPKESIAISNHWNAGVVCIPNNGWFTDNVVKTIERFGKEANGHLRIHFSINSLSETEMDEFTQLKGSFKRWKETVAAAAKAAKPYKNVTLIALSTYNPSNMDIFPQLVDFVTNETGVHEFSFHLARSHKGYIPNVDFTNYKNVLNHYFRERYKGNPVLRAYREFSRQEQLKIVQGHVPAPACRAGTLRVVIAPNGDVFPCEKTGFPNGQEREKWLMGNLRENDYNLKEILRKPSVCELRKRITATPCECNHEIDTSLSLLSKNSFRLKVLAQALKYYLSHQPRFSTPAL